MLVWLSVWSDVQTVCIWSSWCHCIPKPHHLLPHLNSVVVIAVTTDEHLQYYTNISVTLSTKLLLKIMTEDNETYYQNTQSAEYNVSWNGSPQMRTQQAWTGRRRKDQELSVHGPSSCVFCTQQQQQQHVSLTLYSRGSCQHAYSQSVGGVAQC